MQTTEINFNTLPSQKRSSAQKNKDLVKQTNEAA